MYAVNWWLRSPNPNNPNNARIVNLDGNTNSTSNAYNRGNGVAADCENSQLRVGHGPKSVRSHKERRTHPERGNSVR